MNDRMNQLRRWMDMAREMGVGGANLGSPGYGRQMNADNIRGSQLMWAERMMGGNGQQQPENFFANLPQGPEMQYQRPERFDMSRENYLAKLMGGQSGYR